MSSTTAVLNGKCPYCERGALFESWFALRETCDVCGARYERQEGAWIGPTTLGYGIGATVGVGGGAILLLTDTYFKGAEIVLGLFACGVVLASYRWLKAWWVGLMFDWGYVYPDPAPVARFEESRPADGIQGATAAGGGSPPLHGVDEPPPLRGVNEPPGTDPGPSTPA